MIVADDVLTRGAELFGVNRDSLRHLGGVDGAVYACACRGQASVIKFVPMPADHIPAAQAKLDFAYYLALHGVSVAQPMLSAGGRVYEVIERPAATYVVSMTRQAPGRHVGTYQDRDRRAWNETLFREWGRMMGRMHALTKGYDAWLETQRSDILAAGRGPRKVLGGWRSEFDSFAAWNKDETVGEKWQMLGQELARLPIAEDCYGLVHNDLHQYNFFLDGTTLTVIDFDVAHYHWFITDIAIPLFHALWEGTPLPGEGRAQYARRFMAHFMRGYASENHLDDTWLARLSLFLAYRRTLLYIVFSDEWGQNPNPWQREQLEGWRRGIVNDVPVVEM